MRVYLPHLQEAQVAPNALARKLLRLKRCIVNRFPSWQEFWGRIVDDASFVAAAPRVATLLRTVLVQCHGGIENERTFIGMKFIHSDAKNRLSNKHMNAVLRTWSEKDILFADDRLFSKMWEHFQQHGLPR